jgi:predicted DNA-binding antitoxin AbrB/MazE fold protein
MTQVETIYQNHVFRRLQSVDLPENQRVLQSIQWIEHRDPRVWLIEVQRTAAADHPAARIFSRQRERHR